VIAHKLHGHGPVRIIALHGWLGDAGDFDPLLPALDPALYSLAAMDYRGYGGSKDEEGPYTISQIALDALALADRLGWDGFDVLGHSMGGKAALLLAGLAPRRVRRLAGITPVFAGPVPFDCETADLFARAADEVTLRAAIIDETTGRRLPGVWSAAMAQRSVRSSRRDAFAAYFRSWSGDDVQELLGAVDHPMLVIGGRHDRSITEEVLRATWMARFPQAELSLMPDSGHYPMAEAPLSLAARLEGFLKN